MRKPSETMAFLLDFFHPYDSKLTQGKYPLRLHFNTGKKLFDYGNIIH